MKLSQLLSTLTGTEVTVTLVDLESGSNIAVIKSAGYEALDNTIENREVKQWSISGVTAIKVVLGEVLV